MLEFGQTPAATDLIKDGTDASFMADVVEASQTQPVIVDFWAPWCGPCKQLGPAIEAAVTKAGGTVKLVKIDIDQNPMVAGQLRVQSIPAVFAFAGGQPIDGFMGAQPASELDAFIQRVIAAGGGEADGGLEEAVAAADEMLAEGAVTDAAQTYSAILGEDPENTGAYAGLAKAYLAMEDTEKAEALLKSAPEPVQADPAVAAVLAQIELAGLAGEAGEIAPLKAKLEADPNDHQARFDLATAELGAGDAEAAIASLLELFRRDRDWNDGAAKDQLFKIFESLGPEDALAKTGRRKLSSLIFA